MTKPTLDSIINQYWGHSLVNSQFNELKSQILQWVEDNLPEKNGKKQLDLIARDIPSTRTGTIINGELQQNERDIYWGKVGYDQAIDEMKQQLREAK